MVKREERCADVTELRVQPKDENGQSVIEGHAAIFDSLSQDLGFMFPFKERINKGAFKSSLEKDDIRALWNHDANYVLGRNKAGTLELTETNKGLRVRIHPPDTQWARDLTESIRRGDVSQMSFGFVVEKETWSVEGKEDIRTLEKVKLYDVSPVTFPAYLDTDVGVRNAMDRYNKYKQEKTKRKAEFERLKAKFKE
ncbi:MAG: HK97 family phage prohead protease [Candidatus Riflebacteria bacterium]|nr:HK97 family phage prohead protease [Candidatus Riflebacteria bacterium]